MEENVVCRTCLRPTKKYVSIFSAPELWGKNIVLAKLIMACAPVIITTGDGLPTKICENCLQLLQLSFLFRLRVITANENYKEIIRTQSSPRQQEVTGSLQKTTNLNQIYSTEYIFESIKHSVPSSFKQEPFDIKEEIEDRNNEDSASAVSSAVNNKSTIQPTTLLNKLNRVAPNQQEVQNSQKNKINNIKKPVSCEAELQNKNKSNINPNVENSTLLENVNQNIIIGNEEQIDNELNLKLINYKQRLKRTYSKISNSRNSPNINNNSVSKIPKLQNYMKKTTDEWERLNDSKDIKTNNSNLHANKNNNECIIIDD